MTSTSKAKTKTKNSSSTLHGELSLRREKHPSVTAAQVALLQAVDASGSITNAAKQVGISYKTAWDRIDAMNNLADKPLVARAAGGVKGGGTVLTDYGKQIIEGFIALNEEHDAFLRNLGSKLHSIDDVATFLRGAVVNSSARNQYRGVITRITTGAVNAEVELRISPQQTLVATITKESVKRLGLKQGGHAVALVKASWVILSTDTKINTSARNKLIGKIARVTKGRVNCDITIDLGDGKSLSATITNNSAKALALRKGKEVCGLFKSSSVILLAEYL